MRKIHDLEEKEGKIRLKHWPDDRKCNAEGGQRVRDILYWWKVPRLYIWNFKRARDKREKVILEEIIHGNFPNLIKKMTL